MPDFLESSPIPEKVFVAGREVNVNLSEYFKPVAGQRLEYSIDRFPEGMKIDEKTGEVRGIALNVPINTPFLVSVTAKVAHTEISATEYFPITIVPPAEVAAINRGLFTQTIEQDYLTEVQRWQLRHWVQFIVEAHYACLYLFNGAGVPGNFGTLLSQRTSESGFMVMNFDNYLVITPGEMIHAESGNRGRMVRTIEEVYQKDLQTKHWPFVGLIASDNVTLAKGWV
ncbi:MAG: hypothetical protein AB7F64_02035, partial [Gammaproteobacteria bacterium]